MPCTFCWQDLEAGRTVLAVSPIDISDINRGQLGTKKGALLHAWWRLKMPMLACQCRGEP